MQVLQPSTCLQQALTVTGDCDSEWHTRHLKLSKKALPKRVSVIRRLNDKPSSLVKMTHFLNTLVLLLIYLKKDCLMLSWRNSADLSCRISLAGPLYVHFSLQLIQKYWYASLNFIYHTHLDVIIHLKKLQRRGRWCWVDTESIFFPICFFQEHSQFTGEQEKEESSSLTSRYQYHLLHT